MKIRDLALNEINKDCYLPSIQREFVWDKEKIERLFDSLLQEYPIGNILVWKISKDKNKRKIKFGEVYEFSRDFDEDNPNNKEANLDGVTTLKLVLDGQQRLTALHIGLKGSYVYSHYKKKRREKLYINIFSSIENSENNIDNRRYELEFFEAPPKDNAGELWVRIGDVLNQSSAEDFQEVYEKEINNRAAGDKHLIKKARSTLGQIYHVICSKTNAIEDTAVSFPMDEDEKILNVFVRTNDGGTRLEKADLLLSYMEASKEYFRPEGARKELLEFRRDLNEEKKGRDNYEITKDDVLKASLMLSDLPVQYKVRNFNKKNLKTIDEHWLEIKKYLRLTLDLVASYNLGPKDIISKNALLPISYYLMTNNKNSIFIDSHNAEDKNEKNGIIRWLVTSLVHGAFGGASDTTLTKMRNRINETNQLEDPTDDFQTITRERIEEWVEREKYGSRYARLLLFLTTDAGHWTDYDVDHMYAKNFMSKETLKAKEFNLTSNKIDFILEHYNYLPNLNLLPLSVNRSKKAAELDGWINSYDEREREKMLIPKMKNYSIANFEQFFEERKKKLIAKLCDVLDVRT